MPIDVQRPLGARSALNARGTQPCARRRATARSIFSIEQARALGAELHDADVLAVGLVRVASSSRCRRRGRGGRAPSSPRRRRCVVVVAIGDQQRVFVARASPDRRAAADGPARRSSSRRSRRSAERAPARANRGCWSARRCSFSTNVTSGQVRRTVSAAQPMTTTTSSMPAARSSRTLRDSIVSPPSVHEALRHVAAAAVQARTASRGQNDTLHLVPRKWVILPGLTRNRRQDL